MLLLQTIEMIAVLATTTAEVAGESASGEIALPAKDELIPALMIGIPIGLGLAAATGFRIFVPLLAVSIGMQAGAVPMDVVGESFAWVGSPLATIIFGAASLIEVGGYYIPWVDNLLDTVATPAAVIAGTGAVAMLLGDIDPSIKWSLALIAGGGVAGTVQLLTVGTRAASTATTGGVGNPVVSTAEAGGSILFAVLAIVLPIVAGVLAVLLVVWLLKKLFVRKRRGAVAATPAPAT